MAINVGVNSKGTTGSGTSVTTTGVATQATGSVIVLCVVSADATAITIPADSKSNSYTAIAGATGLFAGPNKKIWFFYKENAAGGASHTATANASPADAITLLFQEITGALTASALDTAVTNFANDISSPFTVTGGTQGQAAELILSGFGGNDGTNTASTVGGTFTKTAEEQNGGAFYDAAIAYLITAATTATTPSWTRTGANDTGVSIVGFKEASATDTLFGQVLT